MTFLRVLLISFGIVVVLVGCSKNDTPASSAEAGFLSIAIHDAPDPVVQSLYVSLASIAVRSGAGGGWTEFPANPAPFDLLTLRDGRVLTVLTNKSIPAGDYDELRLVFKDNPVAMVDGKQVSVDAPSATSSGYKIKGTFTIASKACTTIAVDFDAKQSLRPHPVKGFMLRPVIRLDNIKTAACSPEQPLRTPEETLEGFVRALETNDSALAITFLSASIRPMFETILPNIDLRTIAEDYRTFPPQRTDDPIADDERADFLSKRKTDGKVIYVPLSLIIERDAWKISEF